MSDLTLESSLFPVSAAVKLLHRKETKIATRLSSASMKSGKMGCKSNKKNQSTNKNSKVRSENQPEEVSSPFQLPITIQKNLARNY